MRPTATPDLSKKLGLRAGMHVCLLDAPSEAEGAVRLAAPAAQFTTSLEDIRYDMIFFWPDRLEGLALRFAQLQERIIPHGAIWAVIPKKAFAARRGVTFTWEQMQAAGLLTDLVDNKVASITAQEYGTRFVIRKERRTSDD